MCTFCPTSSFIARQVPKRAILYTCVRNLQILRGCYHAAEYISLRKYENSENGGEGKGVMVARECRLRNVTADANENVEVAWTTVSHGGDYFHYGNVTIAGCGTTIRVCDRNIGI